MAIGFHNVLTLFGKAPQCWLFLSLWRNIDCQSSRVLIRGLFPANLRRLPVPMKLCPFPNPITIIGLNDILLLIRTGYIQLLGAKLYIWGAVQIKWRNYQFVLTGISSIAGYSTIKLVFKYSNFHNYLLDSNQ